MSIPPQKGSSKDCHPSLKYKMYENGIVDSLQDTRLPKIPIISKNALNKSYYGLNLVQKRQWAYTSTSPPPEGVTYSTWYKKGSGRIRLLPSPPEGSTDTPKIVIFNILNCTKMVKQNYFRAERCQKYALCQN